MKKTITGKEEHVLAEEIKKLHSEYLEKREKIVSTHRDREDAFSKLIILFCKKISENNVEDNPTLFYESYMSIKVLQLVHITWSKDALITNDVEYKYDDMNDIDVLPGVFSPKYASDSYLWAKFMVDEEIVKGKSVLEMGAGSGVISLYLYKYGGPKRIVAVDINKQAIKNMLVNKEKLNIKNDVFIVKESNLYSEISPTETFDIIFWAYVWLNIEDDNMIEAINSEKDANVKTLLNSVIDPGYTMLHRFLAESKAHLNAEGKVLLITSDFLPNEFIKNMSEDLGYMFNIKKFTQDSNVVKGADMVLDLYQIELSLKNN